MTGSPLRPEIAQSWYRSRASGLRPDAPLDRPQLTDFDVESRLLRAAEPVLTGLAADLEGTRFGLMLADRDACIVDRRFSDASLEVNLDGIGAVLGNRFTEETTGTNSIATVLELRRGVAIHGPEHFMEPMKRFSCYGQPILHPVSRRIEAVLQITGPADEENSLWAPIINRAATDIAQRLLAGAQIDQQRMLAAFQEAANRADSVVVMIAEDIVMSSAGAQRVLEPADQLTLRDIADDAGTTPGERAILLADGTDARVRFRRLAEAPGGVLVEVVGPRRDRSPVPRRRGGRALRRPTEELDVHRAGRVRLLIAGEPGSGRSTVAARLAGPLPLRRHAAAELADLGERRWLEDLTRTLTGHGGLVLIEDIHMLPDATAARTARMLLDSSAWFALTSAPPADLGTQHAALATTCAARLEVPPLRYRRDELPDLARSMLDELAPGSALRVTGRVWDALRRHDWPANLRELRMVLAHVVEHRRSDIVTPDDLPPALRTSRPTRRLSLMEQAEYDAIVRALQERAGNKVHAAELLGISRTTLYKRIRNLGIDV